MIHEIKIRKFSHPYINVQITRIKENKVLIYIIILSVNSDTILDFEKCIGFKMMCLYIYIYMYIVKPSNMCIASQAVTP